MGAGMTRSRKLFHVAGWMVVALITAVHAFAAWVIAPFPHVMQMLPYTVNNLVRAPFASHIVIGDSRVSWGKPVGDSLYMGYGGATIPHLSRLGAVSCALSDAQVTIALGINDTLPDERNLAESLGELDRIIAACGPDRLRLAQAWPADPGVEPNGDRYDQATFAAINLAIAESARTHDIPLVIAPNLTGHTIDGVHFDAATSARYMALLGERN